MKLILLRVAEIADALQSDQDRLRRAWANFFVADGDTTIAHQDLVSACKSLNARIEALLPEIAEAIGVNVDAILQFSPAVTGGRRDPYSIWFDDDRPADFLRSVARYGSLHRRDWSLAGWRPGEKRRAGVASNIEGEAICA